MDFKNRKKINLIRHRTHRKKVKIIRNSTWNTTLFFGVGGVVWANIK